MITALCGGVGGSKLVLGLYLTLPPGELTVIVNTADDLDFCGLHVSPDLDTVTYTLAGLAQRDLGWGIEGDTFEALAMLKRYGEEDWFRIGDRDLATNVFRSNELRQELPLSEVTSRIADALEIDASILPMTDSPVTTRLRVAGDWLHFQEYFVRRRHRDPVDEVRYEGIDESLPAPGVVEAIHAAEATIFLCSNPVLSLLPILNVPGIKESIAAAYAPCVAVSPLVGQGAVSGPAGELMRLIQQPGNSLGVARAYQGLIDGIVIDRSDAHLRTAIEETGIEVLATNTLMRTEDDRKRLADEALAFAQSLR